MVRIVLIFPGLFIVIVNYIHLQMKTMNNYMDNGYNL